MELNEYRELLKNTLTPERYAHSRGVCEEAVKLARKYGADVEKARFAGLVHDITKDYPAEMQLQTIRNYSIILDDVEEVTAKLWHAVTGAAVLKNRYGVADGDVLNAVRFHTTARPGMSLLEKIIYLADFISPDRTFTGVDMLRAAAKESLLSGMKAALDFSIAGLVESGALIHINTVKARNELLRAERQKTDAIPS